MKKIVSVAVGAALLLALPVTGVAASTATVTQIDITTGQGNGFFHPQQIALERSLHSGTLQTERIRMTPLPTKQGFAMAQVPGSTNVYVSDRTDGSIWEMNVDSGKIKRHFAPSQKYGNDMQGIATGLGDDIFVYLNGVGKIQHLRQDGTVLETFAAPTQYGHSLLFKDGSLYLLDDRGTVYQIDIYSKRTIRTIPLVGPDGQPYQQNQTYALMWDGVYFNIVNVSDGSKLYRYTPNWLYHDKIDLQQWSLMGCLFDGQEYLALNTDTNRIYTIRLTDDSAGEVGVKESEHYQYVGNLLTTSTASQAFPHFPEQNVELMYNDLGQVTPDFVKPYVTYLDFHGNPKGPMFDSFVFLPSRVGMEKMFYRISAPTEWSAYVQSSMKDFAVLDQQWAERNRSLHLIDRAKVFLAVPYPNPADDLNTRKALLHAYMDQAIALIKQQRFANLDFRGFYWFDEDANFADPLVVDFNNYVHSKNLVSMWIPYEGAQEVSDYSALGFDEVFQQPNYFFKESFASNINRFFDLAWTGARFGKGVEMELDHRAVSWTNNPDYRQLFFDYLHYGLVEGFLGASKAWYENGTINMLYQAQDPLYDTIHSAIDGSYQEDQVQIVTPQAGDLPSTYKTVLPASAKIRLDLLTQEPYQVQRVTLHTNAVQMPLYYYGTLRVDEELVLKNGVLVKREIGQPDGDLRLGFNVPITTPMQVLIQPVEAPNFIDLPNSQTARAAIVALAKQGIITGMTENGQPVFKPNGQITRAQFAVMLTRAYQLPTTRAVSFVDAQGQWYSEAVAAVTQNGYMSGYDGEYFGPNDPVTEEQVAAILVRALHKHDVRADHTGVSILNEDQIDSWARDAVLEGKALELYGDQFGSSAFTPSANASRGDVAEVLYKALNGK